MVFGVVGTVVVMVSIDVVRRLFVIFTEVLEEPSAVVFRMQSRCAV